MHQQGMLLGIYGALTMYASTCVSIFYFLCISKFLDNFKLHIFFILCNILNCCFHVMSQSLFSLNIVLASLLFV